MSAEVLVMCPACGRPQRAGPLRCEGCAGTLPDVPLPPDVRRSSSLEAPLHRRSLAIREDGLEWRAGQRIRRFPLGAGGVREVHLVQRPLFEALVLGAGLAVLLLLTPWPWARMLALPVLLAAVAICVFARRFHLAVALDGGRRAALPLGTGPLQDARALQRNLDRLTHGLNARGVTVLAIQAR